MTSTNLPVVRIEIVNGKPAVTSLQVAEAFGKDHCTVLADIRNVLEPDDFTEQNFMLSADNFDATSYMDTCNRQKPMYILTRDGFSMVAMGYNGKKAFQFKEAILARLKELEAKDAHAGIPTRVTRFTMSVRV